MQYPCGWVSPFGHCRIKACCQLPDTFRRLPRPSSPLTAKASTVCAYSLDHITPSRLGAIVSQIVTTIKLNKESLARIPALASTTRLDDSFVSNARYVPCFQRSRNRPLCRFDKLVCALSFHMTTKPESLVEPVGIEPTTPCLQSRCSPS